MPMFYKSRVEVKYLSTHYFEANIMKYLMLILGFFVSPTMAEIQYFARFQYEDTVSYGHIINDKIQAIKGSPFTTYQLIGKTIPIKEVTLLTPSEPQKVFAVGMNFASHISSTSSAPPPLFLKLPSSLITSGSDIELPVDANNVHFEGELVLIIGLKSKNISEQQASKAIFGVTAGNDLTERTWQGSDLQWMRAKASDGFGPVGSVIAVGANYNDLLLTTHLNGKIVQQETTANMIHSPIKVVSYLSRYFTLMPGDLIFMGTPGRTQSLKDGDVVSVTIEQVGMVKNTIRKPN
jgi:2-keto-4-pentenoate hydratase/2-oxohepta-3-ene-1,7-dioic acid hydratase in catechol pathway